MRRILFVLMMAPVCLCCLQGEGWFKSPAQATELVSVDSGGVLGNQISGAPAISSDGRYVAFVSEATNLVPGDTNGLADIFVQDSSALHDSDSDDSDSGCFISVLGICLP